MQCFLVALIIAAAAKKAEGGDCYTLDDKGRVVYSGQISQTVTSKTCQRWDSSSPQKHSYGDTQLTPGGPKMSSQENYCRDPDGAGYLWCFTTDNKTRWDKCNVPPCSGCRNDTNVHCAYWAKTGECQKNPVFMECNCPTSCVTPAYCGGSDQSCNCLSYFLGGRCNEPEIRQMCPDSCRVMLCRAKDDFFPTLPPTTTPKPTTQTTTRTTPTTTTPRPTPRTPPPEVEDLKKQVLELQSIVLSRLNQICKTESAPVPTPASPVAQPSCGGATYVRWGRTSCPPESEVVYAGYAGGGLYQQSGAATNPVCLPREPQYANYTNSMDDQSAFMWGAEYQTKFRLPNFDSIDEFNVPCAVCRSVNRTSAIVIPARVECYPGFYREFYGYLMAGKYDHNAGSEFVCVDYEPEVIPGTGKNQDGKLFYFTEGHCSSLPCPPYKFGLELTCVVCSK